MRIEIYLTIALLLITGCTNESPKKELITVSEYLENGRFQKSIVINDTTVILANDSFLVLETKNKKDPVERIAEFLGINCRNCDRSFCENRKFVEKSCFLCHYIEADSGTMNALIKTKLDSTQLMSLERFNKRILRANGGMPKMISKSYFKRVGWHDKYLLLDEGRKTEIFQSLFSQDTIRLKNCNIVY